MKNKFGSRFVTVAVAGAVALSGHLIALASPVSSESAVTSGAETALAAPVVRDPASATDAVTTIVLKSKPKSPVPKGRKVKFLGILSATGGHPNSVGLCQTNQTITRTKGTSTTDASGRFSFTLKIKKKTKVSASFAGALVGTHPEESNCLASSKTITVKVKK